MRSSVHRSQWRCSGRLLAEVERPTTSWAAFKSSRLTDARWCQPKLMVRVKHLAGSKTLRHATVKEMVQ
jgi:hypothetical protein